MRLTCLVLLAVFAAACAEEPPVNPRVLQLPDAPFLMGPPDRFQEEKVYDRLRPSHGIFMSSNGEMVVALSAACPHDGCGVVYESMANQFKCPCCARRFTAMGLARGTPPGEPLAMRRLHMTLEGVRGDPAAELRVDPRVPYTQEKNEWSYRYSLYMFEE